MKPHPFAHFAALLLLTRAVLGVDIEGLPEPAQPHAAKFAVPKEKTLTNGLRVIVVERPGVPLLSGSFIIKAGSEADPAKLSGLASFTAELLTQGTATRTAPQIAQEIEALGASLTSETRWDAIEVQVKTLSANAGSAFEILADVVRRPKFAPDEIERLRRQTLDELRVAYQQPGQVARAVGARVALAGTPYSSPPMGTLTSLPRLQRRDIVALHERVCVPGNALFVMAGNITAEEGFALAEKVFGDWRAGRTSPAVKKPTDAPKSRAILIDMPDAGQAAVYVAALAPARSNDSFLSSEVLNGVLGGGYSSRLNQEIRVKRGLSYGAGSKLITNRVATLVAASCQTKNESAAEVVETMQAELARLMNEKVEPPYLTARKSVLIGNLARQLERNDGYVNAIGELALYGLPLDELSKRVALIEGVEAETVQKLAAAYLLRPALSTIVVGRAQAIEEKLRAIFPDLELIAQDKLDLDSETLVATPRKPKK